MQLELICDFNTKCIYAILIIILFGSFWLYQHILNQFNLAIEKINNKLNSIESSQYLFLSNNANNSKYVYPIDSDNSAHFIPKNVNELILQHGYKQYSHYGYNCFTAAINYNYLSMNIKFNYFANCDNGENDKTNNIELWSNQLVFFDIKKISTEISSNINVINSSQSDWDKRFEYSQTFLHIYLSNKKNFIVDEITIDNVDLIKTLINYSDYKKLVVKSNKSFDDTLIKAHCKTNKIIFTKFV